MLSGGSGGLVVTNNAQIANVVKHLSTTAKVPHRWEYNHDMIGYNYRLPNINATLILSQLEGFSELLDKKRQLHTRYTELFEDMPIKVLQEAKNCYSNYWLICLDLLTDDLMKRNAVLELLNNNNIMTRPLWTPLYKLKEFKNNSCGSLYNCENAYMNILNVPSSPHLISSNAY